MKSNINLDNIYITLVDTKFGGNLGMCTRAMKNFGLSNLIIAGTLSPLSDEARSFALFSKTILDACTTVSSMEQAITDSSLVVGLTRRSGQFRKVTHSFEQIIPEIAQVAEKGKVHLVFGPEDYGLSNKHTRQCHMLACIPSDPEYGSMNLSHAVSIACYELYKFSGIPEKPAQEIITQSERQEFINEIICFLKEIDFFGFDRPEVLETFSARILARAKLEKDEFIKAKKNFYHLARIVKEMRDI